MVLPSCCCFSPSFRWARRRASGGQVFDFFYAVLVFQLGVVLVLGSIALMRFTGDHYFASVALTVFGFGIALFVLAVLWNPLRGFGGLRTYFSRYLLSVGMPFELWMRRIAELAETEPDSRRFLEEALREIASLPWIRGAYWRSPDGEGGYGETGGFATRFTYHHLEVMFHTEISLSPALFLHMRLLAQVVGEFYEGKRRENALRHNAYLQAVHETGSAAHARREEPAAVALRAHLDGAARARGRLRGTPAAPAAAAHQAPARDAREAARAGSRDARAARDLAGVVGRARAALRRLGHRVQGRSRDGRGRAGGALRQLRRERRRQRAREDGAGARARAFRRVRVRPPASRALGVRHGNAGRCARRAQALPRADRARRRARHRALPGGAPGAARAATASSSRTTARATCASRSRAKTRSRPTHLRRAESVSARPARQSSSLTPKVRSSFALESTELAGLRAGVG